MRGLSAAWFGLLALAAASAAAELPTGLELLERSIAYHDPAGLWGRTALELGFEETRPDGSVRATEISIDVSAEAFSWISDRDGRRLAGSLVGETCRVSLDGDPEISAEDAAAFRLSCERMPRIRNYYTYLWGLPMKLRDPGTRIAERVSRARFGGRDVLALRVTYDEAVGGDTWYFYFDPSSAALAGYRFYHDQSKNDGEYITLDGEVAFEGLRLPKTRAWYYNQDDGYLGTDTLVSLTGNPRDR